MDQMHAIERGAIIPVGITPEPGVVTRQTWMCLALRAAWPTSEDEDQSVSPGRTMA